MIVWAVLMNTIWRAAGVIRPFPSLHRECRLSPWRRLAKFCRVTAKAGCNPSSRRRGRWSATPGLYRRPRNRTAPSSARPVAVRDRGGDADQHGTGAVHRPARNRAVGARRHAARGPHGRRGSHARAVPPSRRRRRRSGRGNVIAVSPLLRELILTVCGEPVVWDASGPIRLVAELVLHEIARAGTRPLSLPACRDPRLARVAAVLIADPSDPRDLDGIRGDGRRLGADPGATVPSGNGHELPAMAAPVAYDGGTCRRSPRASPRLAWPQAVGYASVPAFGAAFRETFGTTPATALPKR